MADITITAKNVRPLGAPHPRIRDYIAGGSGNVGEAVYIDNTGKVVQSNAGAAGTAIGIGVVLSANNTGQLTFATGDTVSVLLGGGLTGAAGMTPGALVYLSNNAGKLADAAGVVSKVMGISLTATEILVSKTP